LARGYAISGDPAKKELFIQQAKDAALHINEEEDRNIVLADLETIL